MNSIFGVVLTHACHFLLFHQSFKELFVIFGPLADGQLFDVNRSLSLWIHLYYAFHFIVSIIFADDIS